jgi:hypothetical protein
MDTERTNADRAAMGARLVDEYVAQLGADDNENTVSDIIADLMHYCDTPDAQADFAEALRRAQTNYQDETAVKP